jgi:serine/threonine-protein kinase
VSDIGRVIGGYRIDAVLGRGAMGVEYEATQISLGRTVALKLLSDPGSDDDLFRERFRREALASSRLGHPNILPVYEVGELEGHPFVATRLIRGQTLRGMIAAGELDPARTLRLLAPIADAVDAAHAVGLIHRDIKPENILVGPGDHPYLTDFAIARSRPTRG